MSYKTGNVAEHFSISVPTGLIAVREGANWYYVLKDHLNSTRVVFNTYGQVQSSYDYDSYGKLGRSTINVNIPYRFTGQEFACPATLLCGNFDINPHNFRARIYDSDLGRFMQPILLGKVSWKQMLPKTKSRLHTGLFSLEIVV